MEVHAIRSGRLQTKKALLRIKRLFTDLGKNQNRVSRRMAKQYDIDSGFSGCEHRAHWHAVAVFLSANKPRRHKHTKDYYRRDQYRPVGRDNRKDPVHSTAYGNSNR